MKRLIATSPQRPNGSSNSFFFLVRPIGAAAARHTEVQRKTPTAYAAGRKRKGASGSTTRPRGLRCTLRRRNSTSSSESLPNLITASCGVERQDQDQELHGNSEPTISHGDQDDAVGQEAAAGNHIEHQQETRRRRGREHGTTGCKKRKRRDCSGGQSIAVR